MVSLYQQFLIILIFKYYFLTDLDSSQLELLSNKYALGFPIENLGLCCFLCLGCLSCLISNILTFVSFKLILNATSPTKLGLWQSLNPPSSSQNRANHTWLPVSLIRSQAWDTGTDTFTVVSLIVYSIAVDVTMFHLLTRRVFGHGGCRSLLQMQG